MSPVVKIVPGIPSSRFAVAASPDDEQLAISPAPTRTSEPAGGGGGGAAGTVMVERPVLPPAVALIVAVPPAIPVTNPVDDTAATAEFDDDHANVVTEPAGLAVATSCWVAPIATVALDGVTEIDFTLFGGPPFANDGVRLSGAGGLAVSEQATNTRATTAIDAAVRATVRVRMGGLVQDSTFR